MFSKSAGLIGPAFSMRSPVYKDLARPLKKMKLSILICNIKSRLGMLQDLLNELDYQIQQQSVQILWLGDNKSMSIGKKRNKLLSIADGEYVCFVDDDDWVSEEYISEILKGIESNKKVICFWLDKYEKNQKRPPYRFSKDYNAIKQAVRINGNKVYGYLPGHLCAWKKEVAMKVPFPDLSLSEDHRWAAEMSNYYTKGDTFEINKQLYMYKYDKSISERG